MGGHSARVGAEDEGGRMLLFSFVGKKTVNVGEMNSAGVYYNMSAEGRMQFNMMNTVHSS